MKLQELLHEVSDVRAILKHQKKECARLVELTADLCSIVSKDKVWKSKSMRGQTRLAARIIGKSAKIRESRDLVDTMLKRIADEAKM